MIGRKHLVEGNAFLDPDVYGWRYTTLLGLLSCLAIYDETTSCLDNESRTKLEQWLMQRHKDIDLWGEGAVASLVPWLIWLRKHDPTLRADYEIEGLVKVVIARKQLKNAFPFPSPYYDYEKVFRFRSHLEETGQTRSIDQETFAGSAFTVEALFHILVRTNLKQACKRLWPDFTKIVHRTCHPDNAWEYCTLTIRFGVDEAKVYPSTYNWTDLKNEALQVKKGFVPTELFTKPWLLALWWQVAPYRFTTESSKIFIEGIFPGWGRWGT